MVVKQIQYGDQTRTFPKPKPWGVRTKSSITGTGPGTYYDTGKFRFDDHVGKFVPAGQSPVRYKGRRPVPTFMNRKKKKITKGNDKTTKTSNKISRWIWYFRWKNRRKSAKIISKNKTRYNKRKKTKKTFSRRIKTRL